MNDRKPLYLYYCLRSLRIAALLGFSLAFTGVVLADSTGFPGAAFPTADAAPTSASENTLLIQARIQELKELSASMDAVQANLAKVAERALKDSDSAPTLTERRRYEQLYAETNARLGELQTTRAEITRLLGELEAKLEALQHDR